MPPIEAEITKWASDNADHDVKTIDGGMGCSTEDWKMANDLMTCVLLGLWQTLKHHLPPKNSMVQTCVRATKMI